ncbi:hypothetical protein HD593_008429 [Nonomuraea rubra]|uniref:Uncharacterized protein n=1 Tax=Nonomuraea rubra TaxID=46180 RepID=A0A7X0U3L9_9ACTN|nr:hypothetical protein [Nonomuraea rubra]
MAALLSYWADQSLPGAILMGGGATGAGVLLLQKLIAE